MESTRFRSTPVRSTSSLRRETTPIKAHLFRANSTRNTVPMDRFIPTRSGMDFDVASYNLLNQDADKTSVLSPQKAEYRRCLAENLLPNASSRVLAFKAKAPAPPKGFDNSQMSLYTRNAAPRVPRKTYRSLPQAPDRILDAPDLLDDYYLNLLDWSSTNVLAVALGPAVYLWNAASGSCEELMALGDDEHVTSVSWAADGNHLSIGTESAIVQVWDTNRNKQIRALKGHSARVGALSWNKSMLSSGSRDSTVVNHDVRMREHVVERLRGHSQEVCGLKWSPNGQQLASGGNDNTLNIWEAGKARPVHGLQGHQAAVKALAWCPFQGNLIASGGGTADRSIKFWNTHTGALLNSIDTGSQVCALQWNKHEREILSSHGFSQNQLCLWKYPSMQKVAEFTGHTSRVLHMAQSPDGSTVVSAAADETLRFWKVFGEPVVAQKQKTAHVASSIMSSVNIR